MNIYDAIEYFEGYGSPYDNLIVRLIKKEIPMKSLGLKSKVKALDIETQEVRTYECSPCPSCEKWITKIYNFCPHCGQRIA